MVRMWFGIKLEVWLTICAIVAGPILAFAVQYIRDDMREARNRRRAIFAQLLLTLRAPLAPKHVDALNSIPLEFYGKTSVMQAWREYTSHLNNKEMLRSNNVGWGERKLELLIALAFAAGQSLGFKHIDKATLRDNVYIPQGYEDQEEQFRQIRAAVLLVLNGQRPIATTVVGPIQVEPNIAVVNGNGPGDQARLP